MLSRAVPGMQWHVTFPDVACFMLSHVVPSNPSVNVGLNVGYITDRKARSIKPDDKPIASGVTGFWLHPGNQAGRGRWILRYVSPTTGKRRDMGLGAYPSVSVKRAIERALQAREMIAEDKDPIEARDSQRAIPTFEKAARDHWKAIADSFRNAKYRQDWISSLERYAFDAIGGIKVNALEPSHFARVLEPIWLKVPDTARRVKARCSAVMSANKARGHVKANALDDVHHLLPKQPKRDNHQPAMPWQDVPAFVRDKLNHAPMMGARAALLFAILTAARSGEVRMMEWQEVDLEARLWIVPASHMKAGKEHRVPLSDAAMDLLQAQPHRDGLVFPSMRGKQLTDMAMTSILRRAEAASDVPGRTATQHGFRSSFRDWCGDHEINRDTAERALAHAVGGKTEAAYERTKRLKARARIMQSWGQFVTGQTDTSKITSIRKHA